MHVFSFQPHLLGEPYRLRFYRNKSDMKDVVENLSKICRQPYERHAIVQHQQFGSFEEMIDEKTPFHTNLIRDPVEHYISLYYFRRHRPDGKVDLPLVPLSYQQEFLKSSLKMNFEDCVKSKHKECTNYNLTFTIVPFFCGTDDYCLIPSEKALHQAKTNVIKHYPVVGYLEDYIQYLELCELVWPQFYRGITALAQAITRKPNSNIYKIEPSTLIKKQMKQYLKIEYDFYYWVKKRFKCMYKYFMEGKFQKNLDAMSVSKIPCNFS